MATFSEDIRAQIRHARGNFIAMAVTYSLGTFNDQFFRQSCLLLAVAAHEDWFQSRAMALFAVPYLLFAAFAGWLADRFAKRRIVIATKALELCAMLTGAAGILTGSWPLMLGMVFLMGLQSALFNPSLNGSIPELYPEAFVTTANARVKSASTSAILLGLGLSGIALDIGKGNSIGGIPVGNLVVAVSVIMVSLVGLLASLGVPRRRAAAPDAPFPWRGPLATLRTLWGLRRDSLLGVAVASDAFVWSAGTVELLIINMLGLRQYGLTKALTSLMPLTQLAGLAVGCLASSRLARGRLWYRVLAPAALGLGCMMIAVSLVPLLPDPMQLPLLYALFFAAGVMGGFILVPCEAFIQVRPAAEKRGAMISAGNFAVFTGIFIAGGLERLLLGVWRLEPTTSFAFLGLGAVLAGLLLIFFLPSGAGNLMDLFWAWLVNRLLRLRYRVEVRGLDEAAKLGTDGILFLPNHPGLIDPIIMMATLFRQFEPRAWADEDQVDRFFIRYLARRIGVRAVPSVQRYGGHASEAVRQALSDTVDDLRAGRCALLYPAGHAYRQYQEDLRGNTAVHRILQDYPDARVVLVRTTGIWGSGFTWAGGNAPDVAATLKKGLWGLLSSGFFFAPKREVTLEFHEPEDLPRTADADTLNRYMEGFYNARALHNTYVPYSLWERGSVRELPEPFIGAARGDLSRVPDATRQVVFEHIKDVSGTPRITDEDHLARDLALDSLSRAEMVTWVQEEFGFSGLDVDSMQTVGDVMLAACGELVRGEPAELKPVPAGWFSSAGSDEGVELPDADTICAAFLEAARRRPGRMVIADQSSGGRTYRDVIASIFALRPEVQALEGDRIGIMMPASVVADVLYLTVLFSSRTPVMVNWTAGPRNVRHSLDAVGVHRILTARRMLDRLTAQGVDLSELEDRFVCLEDIAPRIGRMRKLAAWLKSRFAWGSLSSSPAPDAAVILFTSGSETLPKAVPLSHLNILSNLGDVLKHVALRQNDRLAAILPPFHSFGITVDMVLPLCTGIQALYHPDPTEGGMLARLIEAYRLTALVGTPTFLNGIVRASTTEQLRTLRLVVTGAEQCPEHVYDALQSRSPGARVFEGYGVTECSPIVSVNRDDSPQRGTIGPVLPSFEYAIVDPEGGERVQPGERGMLLVRGPSAFSGYLNYDGPPPFVEFEGEQYYRTGDLVSEGPDGVLTFRGRLKRFTKLGGEMISLPAIESVLEKHYSKDDDEGPVLAVDVTSDELHPEIVLFTTLDLDRGEANAVIRQAGLSGLHNIRRVVKVDELPLLGTGKTNYRALKRMLTEVAERSE